jgi:hypothetical protein
MQVYREKGTIKPECQLNPSSPSIIAGLCFQGCSETLFKTRGCLMLQIQMRLVPNQPVAILQTVSQ